MVRGWKGNSYVLRYQKNDDGGKNGMKPVDSACKEPRNDVETIAMSFK